MPLRKGKFRINCCSEHHTFQRGTEIRALILYIFYLIWKDIGTVDVHITLLSGCEFPVNLRSKAGRKEFLSVLYSPVSDMGEIHSKRSIHITGDHLVVS